MTDLKTAIEARLRGTASVDGITPGTSGPAPLSFAQQRLWFLSQLDPNNAGYNIPSAYRIRGPLDVALLRRALDETVRRHQVLRSTMDDEGSGPVQRVDESLRVELPLTVVDGGEDRVAELAREHVARPFDLRRGPLLSAELFQLDQDDHVLLLCLHHVVADQWTLGVLLRELCDLYTAFLLDLPSVLADPPVQYADYAAWERSRLRPDVLDDALRVWRDRLTGLEPLELHTDRPRSAVQRSDGARVRHHIPAVTVAQLRRLAAEQDVTLFMIVSAALSAVLSRYTGQSDVAIGAAIANRSRPELEELIGFFVNTVVLRADLSGDPSFAELLARVRDATLFAHENQDLPFERLVELAGPDRDLSRPPLVNVVLSFLNTPAEVIRFPATSTEEFAFDPGIVKFELDLYAFESGGGLTIDVDYRSDMFERGTVARLLGHLERLLAGAADDPTLPVSALPLLSEVETAQLLVWGNGAKSLAPVVASVPELFAEQVRLRPDAPALRDGDRVLSYSELAERSGRVAAALRSYGTSACVGVCLDRSVELIVTLLGVLRAGAHYLPLDPGYPEDRLRYMLSDAEASVLVTSSALVGRISEWSGPTILVDDELPDAVDEQATGPEDLAYVMYTSGSTGRPKGIRVPHRGIVRLVHENDYAQFAPGDRVAHASSVSFDAATFEIWGALLNGAELVILPQDVVVEPPLLAAALREHGITVMWMTSSLFNHTVREVPDAVAGIGTVVIGGEALDVATVRAVLAGGAPGRLVNGYGPTENTTFSATHHISSLPDDAVSVPIGRPIRGSSCYVMDDGLRLVPAGVPGELCVGGLGLAHGYVGRPELTTERFVANPYGRPGELLYRTGDVVRWRGDGVLEFLGRRDDQIKLRGYRIELGEIEAAVTAQPGVRAAVVLVRDGDGGPRLVGYVIPSEAGLSTSELPVSLAASLPAFMIPSAFVVLDSFPLNANGKVDRKRLPEPEFTDTAAGDSFVAPRTELETTVAGVWAELLGVDRAGATDNFFHLGGNSLLATRVVSRLRRELGIRLTVRTLFDNPTVESFAAAIDQIRESRG
jgi:amino acid adenylation domain-containing protein